MRYVGECCNLTFLAFMFVFVLYIVYILTKHLFSFMGLLKTKYSNGSNYTHCITCKNLDQPRIQNYQSNGLTYLVMAVISSQNTLLWPLGVPFHSFQLFHPFLACQLELESDLRRLMFLLHSSYVGLLVLSVYHYYLVALHNHYWVFMVDINHG